MKVCYFQNSFVNLIHIRHLLSKWHNSVTTIPGTQRDAIDHKQVKTNWFHVCSGGNASSGLTHVTSSQQVCFDRLFNGSHAAPGKVLGHTALAKKFFCTISGNVQMCYETEFTLHVNAYLSAVFAEDS